MINRAIINCDGSNSNASDHFVGADKMFYIGSDTKRKSYELIANLFRISQTEQKLKNENIKLESEANETHYEVGKEIRNTIKRLGGAMPEELPKPNKSLKELEKERKNENKQLHN